MRLSSPVPSSDGAISLIRRHLGNGTRVALIRGMNEINAKARAAQARVFELRDASRAFFRSRAGKRTTFEDLNLFDAMRAEIIRAEEEAIVLALEAIRPR